MNKNLKRRLYALALTGLIMSGVNTRAFAESIDDVDMTPIDIEQAIIDLVPQENNNNSNNNNNNSTDNNNNNNNSTDNNNNNNNNSTDNNNGNNNIDNNNSNNNSTENNSNNNGIDNNSNNNNNSIDTNNNSNNTNDNNLNNSATHVNHTYNDTADDVINQKAPTCDVGGSYDEVYYCKDCGEAHIVHISVDAPGHKWVDSNERINETSTGYDVVQYCANKGCTDKHVYHVHIDTPTEPVPTTEPKPTRPGNYSDDNPKTADESLISTAMGALLASGAGFAGLAYLNYKDASKSKYKGKYLSRK